MKKYKSLFTEKSISYVAYIVDRDKSKKPNQIYTKIYSVDKDKDNPNLLKITGEGYERVKTSSWQKGKGKAWEVFKHGEGNRILSTTVPKDLFKKEQGSIDINL